MNTPARLGAYGAGLAVAFVAALGAGRLIGPIDAPATGAAHGPMAAGHDKAVEVPGGLQVAADGYRLAPLTPELPVGTPTPYRFRVLGPDGTPTTRYTATHERELHLIVVRRDLTGFQHLHPVRDTDGTWTVPVTVPTAGQYRVFADFQPAGRPDGVTLGVDVAAPGEYRPEPAPPPGRTSTVDGYTVTLDGDLDPGTSSTVRLTVSRAGEPVTDLQPYLGAYGHLVALREGDLAYLHVHPEDRRGATVSFRAEVPSAGRYGLFLDFRTADGVVRTATFTATTEHGHG